MEKFDTGYNFKGAVAKVNATIPDLPQPLQRRGEEILF